MKKLALVLATSAVLLGLISCGSTKVEEDDLSAFMAVEAEGPEFKATNESVDVITKNLSDVLGVGVTLVVDKDMSKANTPGVKGASATVGTYLGEKCIKITANYNPEIRFAFVFDKPVSCADLNMIQWSVAGFEGGAGAYNIGLMYEEMSGAEHKASFYLSDISADYWTDNIADLKYDEQWGNNFGKDKEITMIQFWSGDKGPIYVKGLNFLK